MGYSPLFKGTPISRINIHNFEVPCTTPKSISKLVFVQDLVSPVSATFEKNRFKLTAFF